MREQKHITSRFNKITLDQEKKQHFGHDLLEVGGIGIIQFPHPWLLGLPQLLI